MTREEVTEALKSVVHPGKGDKSIQELGLLQNIEINGDEIQVTLGFPKRRDPLTEYLTGATKAALIRNFPGCKVQVKTIVVDEAPAKKTTNDLDTTELIDVKNIIVVASGKGGVGKSTVAVNLACALSRLGLRTGLADADVYGPSVPTMTGTEESKIGMITEEDGRELFIPVQKYGVEWMSIGYFAERGQALIWRGPMACSALKQMILQVKWGPLDFLIVDLPPGTGDIHISLLQDIPVDGAVIVTTPQNVALADVEKGMDMFANKNVNIPVYGLVENMAWFTPEQHPDEKYYIFGKDGGQMLAEQMGVELLASIPLVQDIREGGDNGEPAALGTRPDSIAFIELAKKLYGKVSDSCNRRQ